MKRYTSVLLLLLFIQISVFSQYSIQFTPIESEDRFDFTRIIDDYTYHFSHKSLDGVDYGSEIIRIEDNEAIGITWIYQINDTLFCHHLMDMWRENDNFYLLAYTYSGAGNSVSLLEYKIDEDTVELLDAKRIGEYNFLYHYRFKDLIVDNQRQIVILEHKLNPYKTIGFLMLKINGNKLDLVRSLYDDPVNLFYIYDHYYDVDKELYYILTHDYYFIFDKNFKYLKKQGVVRVLLDDHAIGGRESLIIGKENSKFVIYTRLVKNNTTFILTRLVTLLKDTIQTTDEFEILNPEEDCYLVRKIIKDSCNYMYYSRSSINGHDSNYGFNIISFNKQGELLNNQVFETERPLAVDDIDIDEKSKTVSGVGGYLDDFSQFSFTADLKKDMVSAIDVEEEKSTILVGNIGDQSLVVHSKYFGKTANVFGINGQKVAHQILQNELDVSHLPSGTYIIQVSEKGYIITEKFVKI